MLVGVSSAWCVPPTSGQTPAPPSPEAAHEAIVVVRGVPRLGGERLAAVNIYCLGCHADLGTAPPSAAAHRFGESRMGHTARDRYPDGNPDFVPVRELDKRLVLVDGRLTCISCHSGDDPDHAPVMSTAAGRLCLACHRK